MPNRSNPAAATIVPPAVVTHTIARIRGSKPETSPFTTPPPPMHACR